MRSKYKIFYISSLFVILLLSVYPIYMGIKILTQYFQKGFVSPDAYPKYIIPYTPISIALIVCAALLPLIYRLSRRFCLIIASTIAVVLFLILELSFEKIEVLEGSSALPIKSWQLSFCIATPEVLKAIGAPSYYGNNPAYKVHFYLISILIILSVIGVLYGFLKLYKEGIYKKKKALIVQTACVAVFIGLCILACFTAFFRNGTRFISPLSAFLTGLFFVVFGVTFGMYFASLLYGKRKLLSVCLPACFAILATITMYIGELVLMDGMLFVFGKGFFFEPLGSTAFSLCDISIILLSGIITAILSNMLNNKKMPAEGT